MNRQLLVYLLPACCWLTSVATELRRDTVNLGEIIVTAPLKTNPELIPLNVT